MFFLGFGSAFWNFGILYFFEGGEGDFARLFDEESVDEESESEELSMGGATTLGLFEPRKITKIY